MADSTPTGDLVLYHGPRFGTVPTELITDTGLTAGARLLGALLWTYRNKDTGEAFPSQERMGGQIGVTERTIRNRLRLLESRGWIRIRKRIHLDPEWRGNPNACLYFVYFQRQTGSYVPVGPEEIFLSDRKKSSAEHTKRTDHKNIGGDKAPEISKAETALLNSRVFPRTITRLIRDYPEDRILQKAEHFVEGELVRAIEEDWQLPKEKARGSGDDARLRYAVGQFADFWDE